MVHPVRMQHEHVGKHFIIGKRYNFFIVKIERELAVFYEKIIELLFFGSSS